MSLPAFSLHLEGSFFFTEGPFEKPTKGIFPPGFERGPVLLCGGPELQLSPSYPAFFSGDFPE